MVDAISMKIRDSFNSRQFFQLCDRADANDLKRQPRKLYPTDLTVILAYPDGQWSTPISVS